MRGEVRTGSTAPTGRPASTEPPGPTGATPPADLPAFQAVAAARLGSFPRVDAAAGPGMRRAAVAVCVTPHEGEPSVLVIKRAYRGRNAGQWALPGGRLDDGETPVEAALRELAEELGLVAGPAQVLGLLDDFPARSGFLITPVVVVLDDPGPMRPSPAEVHSVHRVPLAALASADAARWVPQLDGGRLLQLRLNPGMVIHAPTAALLWQFREVVLFGRHERVAHFLQPVWTHR